MIWENDTFLRRAKRQADYCTKHGVLGLAKRPEVERTILLLTTDGTARTEPYRYEFCRVVTEVEHRSSGTGRRIRRPT